MDGFVGYKNVNSVQVKERGCRGAFFNILKYCIKNKLRTVPEVGTGDAIV
jgi:hypothetical protein